MTIDEALKKCKYGLTFTDQEYDQLAEWLEELKERRQTNFDYVSLMDKRYYDGYNKAIDDFAETIKTSQEAHLWYCSDYGLEFCNGDNCEECSHEFTKQIDKIAEKLKQVE